MTVHRFVLHYRRTETAAHGSLRAARRTERTEVLKMELLKETVWFDYTSDLVLTTD